MAAQDNAFEPVHLPAPSEDRGEQETVPLFYLGDREYRIPKRPRTNTALKYLKNVRSKGEDTAAAELLAELLGEEGFNDLADYDDLEPEQFEAVMKAAQNHVLGALEKSRGNSGRGSHK